MIIVGIMQFTMAILAGVAIAAAGPAMYGQPSRAPVMQVAPPPDVGAPPADAEKTASGLASKVIAPGSGAVTPTARDLVTVHYTGWTKDGKTFDTSRGRATPATFPLARVIAGWRECVGLMTVGETRRCWIPEALAYKGQKGRPSGMLVFDIELLNVEESPTSPPLDVAAIPSDAQRTASGLAYKILRPGTGTTHPTRYSRVTVHYTGWTTNGRMFDSSIARGQPAALGLDDVIAGWTEGVQLMVEGEKRRFWIPEDLAYRGQPGSPPGMLVFEIELIKIE